MHTSIKNKKQSKRERRHARIRSRIAGTSERPRLSIFKSNRFLYVQLIDDEKGTTLASASTKGIAGKSQMDKASALGKAIAEMAKKQKLEKVTFDRGGYVYTGRVKAVADGAREAGLSF